MGTRAQWTGRSAPFDPLDENLEPLLLPLAAEHHLNQSVSLFPPGFRCGQMGREGDVQVALPILNWIAAAMLAGAAFVHIQSVWTRRSR